MDASNHSPISNPSPIGSFQNDDTPSVLRSLPAANHDITEDYDILSQSELNPREIDQLRKETELMHASFMSSYNSTVRVEITDESRRGSMSSLAASAILRKCKQQVFRPYSKLLLYISWRPFGRERFNYHWGWKVLNLIYPLFVLALLFYTYAYELLACQGKLEFDVPFTSLTTKLPELPTNSSSNSQATVFLTTQTSKKSGIFSNCNHIITSYIVPDFLHFVAFCLGFWYFRIQDNERMYALIEQVFLLVTHLPRGIQMQTDMIRSMRHILLMGGIWIVANLAVQGIFLAAFGYQDFSVQIPHIPEGWNITLLCIDIFGSLVVNSVNTAVVVNYAVQCETIVFYARSIKDQLLEKSAQLQNIMHDLHRVWQSIRRLNGAMSNMTSLCAFYSAERFVIGLCLLILNKHHNALVWTYRVVYPIMWLVILTFPLTQALRVNATLEELRGVSMEMRVFGYQNSPMQELDSFQQFVANGKVHVKLMCVPVRASYVYGSLILIVFVLLILTQTGVFTRESVIL